MINFKILIQFLRSQITTRNVIVRCNGVLKRRFPILHSGMQLQRLELIQNVICVCCVLHNICIDMGDTGDIYLPMGDIGDTGDMGDTDNDLEILPSEAAADGRGAAPPPQPQPGRATARDEIVAIFAQRLMQGGE